MLWWLAWFLTIQYILNVLTSCVQQSKAVEKAARCGHASSISSTQNSPTSRQRYGVMLWYWTDYTLWGKVNVRHFKWYILHLILSRFRFKFAAGKWLWKEEETTSTGASTGIQTLCCQGLMMYLNNYNFIVRRHVSLYFASLLHLAE